MDTATQAILGATIAQAGFRERLGRRALYWGAAVGLMPDLDVIAVATHGPFGEFLYHRGFTHALWFGPVVGPLLGLAVWRLHARNGGDPGARRAWMWLFTLVLFTHPLLDLFTTYGTQLLAPFSRERFALNGVGIIDPFYTLPLVAALGAGRYLAGAARARAAGAALAFTTLYLLYGWFLNSRAEADLRRSLAEEQIAEAQVRVYPTILQPWLRRFVARTPEEVRVGLYTSLRPDAPVWESFSPDSHPLIEKLRATREGGIFVWFAMDEVASRVTRHRDRFVVEIDDLRYGFPGPPDHGIWGIRAVYDARGRLLGRVERFDRGGGPGAGPLLAGLWRAMWGDFGGLRPL